MAKSAEATHDEGTPFAAVTGPYVLVLRSFKNRMATTHRVTRIIVGEDGKPQPVPTFLTEMPDLTVFRFLTEARERCGYPFVGVSNGTDINGALCLVNTPEARWFDAVRILAVNAHAIIVIPDDSTSLRQEIAHVAREHARKLIFLMPASMPRLRFERELLRVFRIEGLDLSELWASTRQTLQLASVDVATYDSHGGLLTWDESSRSFPRSGPWSPAALASFIESLEPSPGAEAARVGLLGSELPLKHHSMPRGTEGDPSWNRYPFHPWPHLERLLAMGEMNAVVADDLATLDLPEDIYAACVPPWPAPPSRTSPIWQILFDITLLPTSALRRAGKPCVPAWVSVLIWRFEQDVMAGGLLAFLRGPHAEFLPGIAQAFTTIGATETSHLLRSTEAAMKTYEVTTEQLQSDPNVHTEWARQLEQLNHQLYTQHPLAEPVSALLHAYADRHRSELIAVRESE
jgi:hypothetical protein